jgi:hypothetical protein
VGLNHGKSSGPWSGRLPPQFILATHELAAGGAGDNPCNCGNQKVATLEGAKAQFQEELGRLDGRERNWKRLLTSLSLLAGLPRWRRFFVNLLRGVAPLRRGRYLRGWSNICGRNGGLGNDVIGDFGDTSAQSQEAKRCVLRLKS